MNPPTLQGEQWRPFPKKDLSDKYLISNKGRLWSILMKDFRLQTINADGYLSVSLDGDGYNMHTMVGLAFIPKVEGKAIINHIDGNKMNNILSNLEWSTPHDNTQHAHDMGLVTAKTIGVAQYTMEGEHMKDYKTVREAAEETGSDVTMITSVCEGSQKSHNGYRWQFTEAREKKQKESRPENASPLEGNPTYLVAREGKIYNTEYERYVSTFLRSGYPSVTLRKDGVQSNYQVHILVAQTYLKNENNYKYVTHLNGIRTDNRVENLQWVERPLGSRKKNFDKVISKRVELMSQNSDLVPNTVIKLLPSDESREISGFISCLIEKDGRIFGKARSRYLKPRVMGGYNQIQVTKMVNKKKVVEWFYVDLLVAIAHIPNPKKHRYVRHKDGNTGNDDSQNLEWYDYKAGDTTSHGSKAMDNMIERKSVTFAELYKVSNKPSSEKGEVKNDSTMPPDKPSSEKGEVKNESTMTPDKPVVDKPVVHRPPLPAIKGRATASDRAKKLPDYDAYLVDDDGELYNKSYSKLVRQVRGGDGYRYANLGLKNKVTREAVHMLVARAFRDNPKKYEYVRHIDGNKQNNAATNLEWVESL